MEKKATYTVISPPHVNNKSWVTWVAVALGLAALILACVTAAVLNEESVRVNHLETRVMEMESHIEEMLRLLVANNEYDYLEYTDAGDYQYEDDEDQDGKEEITVRRVLRKKRNINSVANELPDPSRVPIYDQAYGVNLKSAAALKGLRLYDSLLDDNDDDDNQSTSRNTPEATENPIKPHHRVSNLWVPKKKRTRLPTSSGPQALSSRTIVRQFDSQSEDQYEDEEAGNLVSTRSSTARRRTRLTERKSRTKSLHGSRRGLKGRHRQHRLTSVPTPGTVVFRSSLVKATSRHDGFSSPNSVVPSSSSQQTVPMVVPQDIRGGRHLALEAAPTSSVYGKHKRRKLRNKPHRRRRRAHPIITLAHFHASQNNDTVRYDVLGTGEHLEWSPAPWMDKLGLSSKYSLNEGTVTVKESGLYYVYAQVLYESGRSNNGFQILVDGIPILECFVPALRPAPTCLTGGLSYLRRNAAVRVRDLENNLTTLKRERSTFFGLVKLMDAPHTAEQLILG